MTELSILEQPSSRTHSSEGRRPSIAARISAMGQNRIGALLLLVATAAAILWANLSTGSYAAFWETHMTVGLGDIQLDFTLHALVNDALMAVFFFTVGLEVRREFAIGELTSWSRAMVPVIAAIAGLALPALLFVLIAAPSGHAAAWGVVISTDTAFLVGALALIGPRVPGRLRVFLLALAVVDDIGALSIIALVYTADFTPVPLIVAAVGLAGVWATRYLRSGRGPVYATLAIIVWFAFLASGVHPTLAGVAIALLVPVYRPDRRDVEHALELARTFRQSPSSEYARAAANSLRESISINERLQSAYAPYVAYVILPLFALANAGVVLSPEILAAAAQSSLTWGIVIGLVVGKLIGVLGSTSVLRLLRVGEFGPGLTLDRIAGGGALCGIGFTISLFIIDLAIDDAAAQNEARVGVLAASVIAFVIATIVFRISDALRPDLNTGQTLVRPVDPARDHVWGPVDAPYTIVEYGDFQCGFCLKASGSIQEVHDELGDRLRYVWRHAPLVQQHPNALAGAEASEAAAMQGHFFEFERGLFADQDNQRPTDIIRLAQTLGLDVAKFERDLVSPEVASRVRDDMFDAEAMSITSVPTFFVNGRRHTGPYDAQSLIRALQATADDGPDVSTVH
ncbi:Na+/H+ antiporter NhaA [uncultured Microbacterium sp.]|uniref:Na(+)/H(+) antiporter NhaA n=1 Tax=uncultured Microbacterium sp. TaxID=191216 RepID=A0A1Y5NUA5_9MICO|nr:Na+/H+ antiporter NhaA [uncultured Microbacterium sp.]SBS69993.1 Na(+)/H(+) antiporter NhaA 1 [uncultured Microbacterium sp.]